MKERYLSITLNRVMCLKLASYHKIIYYTVKRTSFHKNIHHKEKSSYGIIISGVLAINYEPHIPVAT